MTEQHIKIEFATDGEDKGTPEEPKAPGNTNPEDPTEPKDSKGGGVKTALIVVAASTVKKSIGYATSNVGKWTGSSQAQQAVDSATKMVGYGAAIAANPALGLATVAFDLATKALDYAFERKWQDRETEELRRRSGYYLSGDSRSL